MTQISLLLAISLFLLSACNFKAVHSTAFHQSNNKLAEIEIEPINSIEGTSFYQHLSQLLPTSAQAKYILKTSFTMSSSPLAIQKNSDVLRENISQNTKYELYDKNNGKLITSGQFSQITSYNTTFTPFATYSEKEQTHENSARSAAEEVRNRLILYFAALKQ